jgi:hypothetical protein
MSLLAERLMICSHEQTLTLSMSSIIRVITIRPGFKLKFVIQILYEGLILILLLRSGIAHVRLPYRTVACLARRLYIPYGRTALFQNKMIMNPKDAFFVSRQSTALRCLGAPCFRFIFL